MCDPAPPATAACLPWDDGYGVSVYRFLLTPRWLLLHAVAVAGLVGCLVLGWWQFNVYEDSQGRHNTRDRDPVPVAEVARAGAELGAGADRQAVAEGVYLADQQLLVPGRIHDNTLGSFVLTPLRTDDGMVVPVVRGWVFEPDDPATEVPSGPVTVTGFLLPPETPDHATVRTGQVLDPGQVAYVAPDQLEQRGAVPAADALHGYLLLQDESPQPPAAPATLDVDAVAPIRDVSPWQNLSYWAQWWVFAIAAIVFWVSIVRSAVRTRRAETDADAADDDVSAPAPSHAPS